MNYLLITTVMQTWTDLRAVCWNIFSSSTIWCLVSDLYFLCSLFSVVNRMMPNSTVTTFLHLTLSSLRWIKNIKNKKHRYKGLFVKDFKFIHVQTNKKTPSAASCRNWVCVYLSVRAGVWTYRSTCWFLRSADFSTPRPFPSSSY